MTITKDQFIEMLKSNYVAPPIQPEPVKSKKSKKQSQTSVSIASDSKRMQEPAEKFNSNISYKMPIFF